MWYQQQQHSSDCNLSHNRETNKQSITQKHASDKMQQKLGYKNNIKNKSQFLRQQ